MYKNFYNTVTNKADLIQSGLGPQAPRKTGIVDGDSSKGLMRNAKAILQKAVEERANPEETVQRYIQQIKSLKQDVKPEKTSSAPDTSLRPKPKGYIEASESLLQDEAFMERLDRMKEKYPGLTDFEIFSVIQGESGFKKDAVSTAGAVGLFQIMEGPLAEIGWTPEEVLAMEPAEQLAVYEQYLDRWNYDGNAPLALLQAAPAYRNASDDTVVYKKGTPAWNQNSNTWAPDKNSDITVGSIKNYYRKFSQ
jgi:hypothetical protein